VLRVRYENRCRVGARDEGKREEIKKKGSGKWASPPFYTIMRGVGGERMRIARIRICHDLAGKGSLDGRTDIVVIPIYTCK
jgi:hypothetical protein